MKIIFSCYSVNWDACVFCLEGIRKNWCFMKEDYSLVGCFTQISALSREMCYYVDLLFQIYYKSS